jgi:hypothetical protein
VAAKKKTSSGSGRKSKRTVKDKMGKVMHEYKHHELKSGRSGKSVKNRKQAIAIGLSEARKSGADIPENPKKSTKKKSTTKKSAGRKSASTRAASKKK